MKHIKLKILLISCCISLLAACSPQDSQNNSSLADLNKALGVASNTMTALDNSNINADSTINKDNVTSAFSQIYADQLNKDPKLAHLKPIGVIANPDGSFSAFTDKNQNRIKDPDEKELFKLEADAENGRLVASNEKGVAEQPHSFMGSGFFMGMLLGNMLSRQRMSGVNPASRRATPSPRKSSSAFKKSSSSGFRQTSPSARSRAGSGSFSSGK